MSSWSIILYFLISTTDVSVDLDILLLHLWSQLTPKWKEFGLAAGIAEGVLDSYSTYPPEECIVEVLDKWIRSHTVDKGTKATWKDVAVILKEIGLHQLAESILKSELETAQSIYTNVYRQTIYSLLYNNYEL